MKISQEEIDTVIQLSAAQRYSYFIVNVVSRQEAWGLYDDANGWVLYETEEGQSVFSLWPAKEYAALCLDPARPHCQPKAIGLADILHDLIPHFKADALIPGIFLCTRQKILSVNNIRFFDAKMLISGGCYASPDSIIWGSLVVGY
ncbi:MAG: DUF2750 domain-containing protein [Pseudomonadota bacterium]|nr:DUF2750 domain-containing protein [Gammaproteobacteria bacterium]MBU2546728.1 DUF2750 domain-containing protein [Gammaproteobacteria bacterium]